MIGKRIQRARKASGLSLRELAQKVGVSHAAIKKYEDDEAMPSSDMLIKLCEALNVRADYFFRRERQLLGEPQYRNHEDIPPRQKEKITAILLNHVERRMELESLFPSPPVQVLTKKEISKIIMNKKITSMEELEDVADRVREQWDLGQDPIPDLIDLFEKKGIKVVEIDKQSYPTLNVNGMYVNVCNQPIFVIGNQWPGDRQRFTLAHELGHLLLDEVLARHLDKEKCCNRFAGAFLLPKKPLLAIMGIHRNDIEPRELSLIKQEYGISMQAILHRAEDLEIISSKLYKQLRKEFDEREWNIKEPGPEYPREVTHLFEQMVFRALAEDYIGESKAAELMQMPLDSFRVLRMMERENVGTDQ